MQKLVFVDKSGVENVCEVTTTAEQPIKIGFKLPVTAAEGKGHLTLFTKAGVEGGEVVTTNSKVVTALATTDPYVASYTYGGTSDVQGFSDQHAYITGANLGSVAKVTFSWMNGTETVSTDADQLYNVTNSSMELRLETNSSTQPDNKWTGKTVTVTFKDADGAALTTHAITFL